MEFPDGRSESKAIEYGRRADHSFVALYAADGSRLFHFTTGEGLMRATQFNVGAAYVEVPFDESLIDAFTQVGATQIGVTVPPALAASCRDPSSFTDSFGFGVIPALEYIEELSNWVSANDLPVSVWAVDTLEATSVFEEQSAQARRFLQSRALDLPVLIDVDDAFFAGMHSPGLPSTVIIAPDGSLAGYHSGLMEGMTERLQAEITALVEHR